MANTTKLNDITAKRVCDAIGAGCSRPAAAAAARIGTSTLYDWLGRGRRGEPGFAEFLEQVKKAESDVELEAVGIVRNAATKGTWQAAAWLLERKFPKRWALQRARLDPNEKPLSPGEAATEGRRVVLEYLRSFAADDTGLREQALSILNGGGDAA